MHTVLLSSSLNHIITDFLAFVVFRGNAFFTMNTRGQYLIIPNVKPLGRAVHMDFCMLSYSNCSFIYFLFDSGPDCGQDVSWIRSLSDLLITVRHINFIYDTYFKDPDPSVQLHLANIE